MTLDKGLHISEPQFPHLQNGNGPSPITTALVGWQQSKYKDMGKNACYLFSPLPHKGGSSKLDLEG